EFLEGHLQIERLFASHNLAIDELLLALHRFTPDLAKAKSKISNLKSEMRSGLPSRSSLRDCGKVK
ncbi:MAG: hypothetical protein WA183_01670, partial [Chthoniobacterales bacterium]